MPWWYWPLMAVLLIGLIAVFLYLRKQRED